MLQTFFLCALVALHAESIKTASAAEVGFWIWFFGTVVLTYTMYAKAAFTDPGTIRTQIYLNQNTEESANHIGALRKSKRAQARKPSTVLKELERPGPGPTTSAPQSKAVSALLLIAEEQNSLQSNIDLNQIQTEKEAMESKP